MDPEQIPISTQSLEELQPSGFEDLCHLRSLIGLLVVTPNSEPERCGSMQRYIFESDIAYEYNDDSLKTDARLAGEFYKDPVRFDTFELRFVYKEVFDQCLPDFDRELCVEIIVLEGMVVNATITETIMGEGFGEGGAAETVPITNYSLEALEELLSDFVHAEEDTDD